MASKKVKIRIKSVSPPPKNKDFLQLIQESSQKTFGQIQERLQDMQKIIDDLEKLQ